MTTHGRFLDASARLSAAEGVVALDPIVIDTRPGGLSGHEPRERLFKENRVHLEMSTASVVVAVIGAGPAPDVERFLDRMRCMHYPRSDTGDWVRTPCRRPDHEP